jgi:hypothetical protein
MDNQEEDTIILIVTMQQFGDFQRLSKLARFWIS